VGIIIKLAKIAAAKKIFQLKKFYRIAQTTAWGNNFDWFANHTPTFQFLCREWSLV
jgi:hypothetical protein